MSIQVKRRREAATFLATFTGAQGELIVDTTNNRVQVHDGVTAGGWPAAKLGEVIVNTRTAVSDANYAALTTDRSIAYTAITAARSVTLPASSGYPTGTRLVVFDESGSCSATNTISVARAGSDTIDGATSALISSAYGYLALQSNGAGKWTIVDQATTSLPAVSIGTPFDPNNVLSVYGQSALFSGAANFNVTVNKGGSGGASSDTASFIFEDGFVGYAQIGLCGDDNFHFKVSNGSTWFDAIDIVNNSGLVKANYGLSVAGGAITASVAGFGTETNPQAPVVVSKNAQTGLALATNTQLGIIGVDGSSATLDLDSYTNGTATAGGTFVFRTARGTGASPANQNSGDLIGVFGARPYTNGAFATGNTARIGFFYGDSSPNWGTYIEFDTTPAGSTTRAQAMRVFSGVIIGTGTTDPGAGNLTVGGAMQVGAPTGGVLGAGTINLAGGIYLNNSAYTNPDFVFERYFTGKIEKYSDRPRASAYRGLMALDDLAAHVRETLRLPGIDDRPTDVFERADIALEKLEELTLYILQLHRRVAALESARG